MYWKVTMKLWLCFISKTKEDFIIPREIMKYTKCHIPTLPFYVTQIINSFLNSMNPVNHDKVDELSANGEIKRSSTLELV